jgi:hypothetical protein
MPPRSRNTASKKDEPSIIDQMADDVASVELPTEYPPGAPEFKVYLALRPRSRRSEFKRLLADLAEMNPTLRAEQAALSKLKEGEREAASMRLWARMDEMYELVERALRLVAVDVEKFDAWAAEVSDEELQTTWAVYQTKAQPGEASSSAS